MRSHTKPCCHCFLFPSRSPSLQTCVKVVLTQTQARAALEGHRLLNCEYKQSAAALPRHISYGASGAHVCSSVVCASGLQPAQQSLA